MGDAFWLVGSASNRRLAEIAWKSNRYDPNSAVFDPPSGDVQLGDVVDRLDDVGLHHPEWREIRLSGVPWTAELRSLLESRKFFVERITPFIVLRR